MKKNVGQTDRMIRIVVGVALLILRFASILTGTMGVIAIVVGIILIATGFLNFCPIWAALKINTKKS